MKFQPNTAESELEFDLRALSENEGKSLMGSVFQPGKAAVGKVLHWKRHWVSQFLGIGFLFVDLFLVTALYLVMVAFWYDGPLWAAMSQKIHFVLVAASIGSVYMIGGYDYHQNRRSFRFACEHMIVSAAVFVLAFFAIYSITFYGKNVNSARMTVLVPLVAFPALSILYRHVLSRVHDRFRVGNAVCIIGSGLEARDIYRRVMARETKQKVFVVDFDESRIGKHLLKDDECSPVVESLELLELSSSMGGKFVESYVVSGGAKRLPEAFVKSLAVAQFNGNRVYTYESFLSQVLRIVPPSQLTLEWAFSDGFRLNRNLTYDRMKRMCDIVAAVGGIVVLSPVLALTALAVKLSSPGPVIFKQTRVGEKEKPFTILKFRTMKVGSEKGNKYTQVGDARITPVGNFLRKSRLDEFPQLWNVLVGDLALIGPRAEWIELVNEYEKKFPYYHFRHAVKPGITGWAQVNHGYGADDEDTIEKLYYDLYYVRHFSLILDFSICVKTVFMMLFGKGR